jgi:hypothetical protein
MTGHYLKFPKIGNDAEEKMNSIAYWDILVSKFKGKKGYGISFGDSEDSKETIGEFVSWKSDDEEGTGNDTPVMSQEEDIVESDDESANEKKRKKLASAPRKLINQSINHFPKTPFSVGKYR